MEADKYLVEAMVVVATEKADEHRLVCRPADHASRCTFRTRRRLGGFSSALNELEHSVVERVLVGGFSLAADELIDSSMDEPDAGCRGSSPVFADDALEM